MDGITYFMAKLRRSSSASNPLSKIGFSSFVEDYLRSKDTRGYKSKRRAQFINPKFNGKLLENAEFTKVETGLDTYAKDFARGWGSKNGFVLETGKDRRTARGLEDPISNHTLLKMIK